MNNKGASKVDFVIGTAIFMVSFLFVISLTLSTMYPSQSYSKSKIQRETAENLIDIFVRTSDPGLAVEEGDVVLPNIIDGDEMEILLNIPYQTTKQKLGLDSRHDFRILILYENQSLIEYGLLIPEGITVIRVEKPIVYRRLVPIVDENGETQWIYQDIIAKFVLFFWGG